jgi:hypothetical protein
MDDDDLRAIRLDKQVVIFSKAIPMSLWTVCGGQLGRIGVVFASIRPWEKKCEPT